MSEYEALLQDVRESATRTAKLKIPELYEALKKEGKSPKEARTIIEHDLSDIYQKRTIVAYLPDECKDEKMQELGEKPKQQFTKETVAASVAAGDSSGQALEFAEKPETNIKKLENTFAKAAEGAAEQVTNARLVLLENKIKEFEDKLQPFKTGAHCWLKDTELILNVEVDPIKQKVIVEINEAAMARRRA